MTAEGRLRDPISAPQAGTRRRLLGWGACAWVALVGASATIEWRDSARTAERLAREQAYFAFEKDLVYRRWAAMQGGLYVVPSEHTPPNPFLATHPARDVITADHRQLTLVNPAYMTRQVHELGAEQGLLKGHITSLRPINPGNAADLWEEAALRAFESGAREVSGIAPLDGRPHMRLMRPLTTEASCLTCHAAQGYRLGEIRGGLSVSVPFDGFFAAIAGQRQRLLMTHLVIGLIGLAGLWVGNRRLRQSEQDLLESEGRHRTLFEHMPQGAFRQVADGRIVAANPAALRMLGIDHDTLLDRRADSAAWGFVDEHGAPLDPLLYPSNVAARTGQPVEPVILGVHREAGGEPRWLEVSAVPEPPARPGTRGDVVVTLHDVTSRRRTEAALERLGQATKMESIGRLAGGVAHDFNNQLCVILGHTEAALEQLPSASPLREPLAEAHAAALRSAELTRQLLAFARRQPVAPRPIDLNEIVGSSLGMLRRLMGEHIELRWKPAADPWSALLDPSQVDQILINLCVNARDALNGGGQVTIGTRNVTVDEPASAEWDHLAPGEFVQLEIADNGAGIAEPLLPHIFEPFFTTKPAGQGTGLGLATVYGVVTQNDGAIRVRSRVGQGTRFEIVFPRRAGAAAHDAGPPQPASGGNETILLVEDESALLRLATMLLTRLGYGVIPAGRPEDALRLAERHAGAIDLLVTDLVMPGMNGRELAARITARDPRVKCLFVSGYSADVIAHQGVIDEGAHLLEKPFSLHRLAASVREALASAAC